MQTHSLWWCFCSRADLQPSHLYLLQSRHHVPLFKLTDKGFILDRLLPAEGVATGFKEDVLDPESSQDRAV
jgi:hypothetical protein